MEPRTISKSQIQYLQARRRALGVDDETYAAMKRSVGVESTTELDYRKFNELLHRLGKLEMKARRRGSGTAYKRVHSSAYASGMHVAPPEDKAPMLGKIEAILTSLKEPWDYADAIAKKMFGVDLVRWCDPGQTYRLLQALIIHQNRRADMEHEQSFYLKELRSEGCMCGKTKKSAFSFCWTCYQKLPADMQKALYRKMGKGYEQAYDAANAFLTGEEGCP